MSAFQRILCITAFTAAFLISFFYPAAHSLAAEELLKEKYAANDLKILIVPGHDDKTSSGAVFRGLREADLNLLVAHELVGLLKADSHFKTFFTRDANGYTPDFSRYLEDYHYEIVLFRDTSRRALEDLLSRGVIQKNVVVHHNYASESDSIKLYGINKWANDNGVDLVVHIHFNDHPDRSAHWPGKYSGFSIYIPEKQLPNHEESMGVAKKVSERLRQFFPTSDHPLESEGIIEDQELIAVGPASWSGAALLVEYGYIYESQFVDVRVRPLAVKELAYQTYLGIKDYFESSEGAKETALLPYEWKHHLQKGLKGSRDVLVLQTILAKEGLYSPTGFSQNECGITGNFGECTHRAIVSFQKKFAIPPTGFVGPLTLAKLNELYFYPVPKPREVFSYHWGTDLYYGIMDSGDVQALQNALFLEGVYRGPMTGNFMRETRAAVIQLQKKYNFAPGLQTGYVGSLTRALLNEAYAKASDSL